MSRSPHTNDSAYNVRQATDADLPILSAIKPPAALHKDRLRDADGQSLLYLVVHDASEVVGFGLLVFERPDTWSDAGDTSRLPGLIDLFIRPDRRGRGAGSFLIGRMEAIARSRGADRIYLGVDPVDNPRAHRLYLRLGYAPLQDEPYRDHWRFTDSDGRVHEGNDWNVDMVKTLA